MSDFTKHVYHVIRERTDLGATEAHRLAVHVKCVVDRFYEVKKKG